MAFKPTYVDDIDAEQGMETPAETYVVTIGGDATMEIDLSAAHYAELVDPLRTALARYGRKVPHGHLPAAHRARPASGSQESGSEHVCPFPDCEYGPYTLRSSLLSHVRAAHGDEFADTLLRRRHERREELVCAGCGRGFAAAAGLRSHQRSCARYREIAARSGG